MTRHDDVREQLALRLYDELTPAEGRALDAHLEGCAACRAFAADLGRGLGAVVPSAERADDLPADWRARLDRATAPRTMRARAPVGVAAVFAAGLAAGLLVALWAPGRAGGAEDAGGPGTALRFATNAPGAGASEDALALDAPPPLSIGRALAGLGRRSHAR